MGFSETVDTILKLTDLKSGNFRDVSVGRIKNLSCTDEKSGKGGGEEEAGKERLESCTWLRHCA